mgnify:CR=1 FL=1
MNEVNVQELNEISILELNTTLKKYNAIRGIFIYFTVITAFMMFYTPAYWIMAVNRKEKSLPPKKQKRYDTNWENLKGFLIVWPILGFTMAFGGRLTQINDAIDDIERLKRNIESNNETENKSIPKLKVEGHLVATAYFATCFLFYIFAIKLRNLKHLIFIIIILFIYLGLSIYALTDLLK